VPNPQRVTAAVVRRLALALPEAVAGSHFATPDFRVQKKIFASLPKEGAVVVLKSTPANVSALVAADAATFGDAWRGRWVSVRLDRITAPVLRDLMADAWRTVAPKRLLAQSQLSK
jgi:hypothetical protein